jgi:DNA-binding MarR family transcriptional regulator
MVAGSLPADSAFRALIRTFGLIDRVMHPYFAKFGISGTQWGVLRALHRAEADGKAALSVTELSDRLVIRPPSVTGVIDRMVREGLVSREPLPADMRVKQIRLKPKARELLLQILSEHENQIGRLLGGLTPAEQMELHRLLVAVGDHLQELAKT